MKKLVENFVQEKSLELEGCPFCKDHDLCLCTDGVYTFVHCLQCGASGPHCRQENTAIMLWNLRN